MTYKEVAFLTEVDLKQVFLFRQSSVENLWHYGTQMGISSEFLRRRVLSAISGLAEGEDSARTKLEGGGGSFFTRFCPIMLESSESCPAVQAEAEMK